ncbi:hypothetical protein H6F89_23805 [Cyanobacteria bacterium FACHB-63]|nr:hypothetical protein [Cyanobacteria bacterium FACHB-63]
MKEQLEQRMRSLRNEYATGQQALLELEAKQASLRDTLLRISGAIQVLEEELQKAELSNKSQFNLQEIEAIQVH